MGVTNIKIELIESALGSEHGTRVLCKSIERRIEAGIVVIVTPQSVIKVVSLECEPLRYGRGEGRTDGL